jgi:hypothetical protein
MMMMIMMVVINKKTLPLTHYQATIKTISNYRKRYIYKHITN